MADFQNISELMNTTTGMDVILNNTKTTGTSTVAGVDWFTFNGTVASNLYISGYHYVRIGSNSTTSQLNVCYRSGANYYIYRQEGTIKGHIKFLKIRVEGYNYASSTSSSYALKFELFLFDTQAMLLNVVQTPTSSSYTGSSSLVCGTTTTNLTIGLNSTMPVRYTFNETAADGKAFSVVSGIIDLTFKKYLLRSNNMLYSVGGEAIESQVPSADAFLTYGADSLSALNLDFMNANDVDILWWSEEASTAPPSLKAHVYQDGVVLRTQFDLSDETYVGIEKVRMVSIGNLGVRYSPDNATWSDYYADEDFMDLNFDKIWEECSATKMLYIEVELRDESSDVTSILLYPKLNR